MSSQLFLHYIHYLSIPLHTNSWDDISRTLFVNSPVAHLWHGKPKSEARYSHYYWPWHVIWEILNEEPNCHIYYTDLDMLFEKSWMRSRIVTFITLTLTCCLRSPEWVVWGVLDVQLQIHIYYTDLDMLFDNSWTSSLKFTFITLTLTCYLRSPEVLNELFEESWTCSFKFTFITLTLTCCLRIPGRAASNSHLLHWPWHVIWGVLDVQPQIHIYYTDLDMLFEISWTCSLKFTFITLTLTCCLRIPGRAAKLSHLLHWPWHVVWEVLDEQPQIHIDSTKTHFVFTYK